jgi:competence protein ComEC
MSARHPALRFTLLFAAGIILASRVSVSPVLLFAAASVLILLSISLFFNVKPQYRSDVLLQCSIVILGGLLQTIQRSDLRARELDPSISDEPIVMFGSVDSEPAIKERRISFVLYADSIVRDHRKSRDRRRVMITLRTLSTEHYDNEIEFGKKIELHGKLEPFPFQRNPGEFDYGKYMELNDIQGTASIKGLQSVRVIGNDKGISFQTLIYSIQHKLYSIIDRLHSSEHAGFLKGIIFGYRADIPPDVKQSFIDTGTIHILAVSGSNVAFVAFVLFSVLGFFRLPRRAVGISVVLGLIVYMLITGSNASVVRATIMAIVLICGSLLERKADIYNSISTAALIIIIWNTNALFDVGFQLSFAAVISIVFFYPRLESFINILPERFHSIKIVLKLSAVSLAAQLGTVPFTAYYFGRVSIVSLIANIPVVPISGLNTFIGFTELFFFFISRWMAGLYAAVNDLLVWLLLGFVKQASIIPFAYLEAWHFNTMFIVFYYMIVLCVFYMNRPHVSAFMVILVLTFGNYLLFKDIWFGMHRTLNVTAMDVGQGDAILIEFPNGKRMLIDTGPRSKQFDAGERVIVPFLKRKGITDIDYLLITHPHSDHIGGALAVLKSIHIDTIIASNINSADAKWNEIVEAAKKNNIGIRAAQSGDQIQIYKDSRAYILAPDSNVTVDKNLNNSSVVLKIIYRHSSILFVGDQEIQAEEKITPRYGKFLLSEILKVGHHGSITSTGEVFLNAVHPLKAVISVGMHNQFRHPSPFTLNRLKARSIDIERTDKSGAIVLVSDGMKWTQEEWRKMPLSMRITK